MSEHTPRVPEEAVEALAERYAKRDGWTGGLKEAAEYEDEWTPGTLAEVFREEAEQDLAAALPAIHAERDRAWMEALLSDKARRALADMVGSAYDRGSVLTLTLGAVIDAALDSLQVSGGAGLDAGDSDQRSTASAAETEAACSPAASVESSGTDKPQPEGEEGERFIRLPATCDGSDHQGGRGESEFVRLRKRLLGEAVEAVAKQGYAAVQKPYYDEGDWEAMSQEERDRWTDPIRNIVAKAWNEATGHADFSLAPDQPPVDHSTQPDQDRSPGEGADWPEEVWLNRFTDLPLEWWANPSTVADPDDIAGKAVAARRYVAAQQAEAQLREVEAERDAAIEEGDRLEVENRLLEDANRSLAKMWDAALEGNLAAATPQPDQDRSPGEGAEQRSPQPDPQDQEGRAVTVESIRQAFANGYWLKAAHRMIEAALDAALPSTEPTESKGEREINRCAGTGRRRNIMWPLEGPKHVPCPGCPDCQPPDPTEGQQGGGEDGDVDPATHHTAGEQGGDRG